MEKNRCFKNFAWKKCLLGTSVVALLVGCSPNIIETNNVALKLNYQSTRTKMQALDENILLLKPAFQYSDNVAKEYENKFKNQIALKVEEILQNQGYKVISVDSSDKDDLSFAQKKEGYLTLSLSGEIVLRPDPKRTTQKKSEPGLLFSTGLDKMQGVLISAGFIKLTIMEPISGETLDSFTMDLSELDIQEKFLRTTHSSHTGGLASTMVKGLDNSNDAIKSALNKMFVDIMQKIDKKLTQANLESYKQDAKELKGKRNR
ncbi:HpaA family protein [Helicobacter acinonychis]|uniref:Neuraminyllactose-binding hemagglutinin n=1 Tax=Helicobacter acinonychis (strain Sheeba) TaxID=382638 RepID=Q17XD0_HELAH|nr:HpaA family protein [Helicobacter acinonychis]CAJ99696.1 Neuraminyllactose-binding hemagglutinin precursor [Helicobacter acinonychis str. Sheeba]STP04257.1 neuraminyllactose-binding hemagglutinin [Helicobacter acinonychis]